MHYKPIIEAYLKDSNSLSIPCCQNIQLTLNSLLVSRISAFFNSNNDNGRFLYLPGVAPGNGFSQLSVFYTIAQLQLKTLSWFFAAIDHH
jgi:hypothetical protein